MEAHKRRERRWVLVLLELVVAVLLQPEPLPLVPLAGPAEVTILASASAPDGAT